MRRIAVQNKGLVTFSLTLQYIFFLKVNTAGCGSLIYFNEFHKYPAINILPEEKRLNYFFFKRLIPMTNWLPACLYSASSKCQF